MTVTVVVEHRFSPALDLAQPITVDDRVGPCLPAYEIGWRNSWFACDGTRGVCVYDAPDAETVRRAYRAAGVQFAAVWSARPLHRGAD